MHMGGCTWVASGCFLRPVGVGIAEDKGRAKEDEPRVEGAWEEGPKSLADQANAWGKGAEKGGGGRIGRRGSRGGGWRGAEAGKVQYTP